MLEGNRGTDVALVRLREAEETYERLRRALAEAGVVLPSLRVDLASCADRVLRGPLLELGGCNLATAERLAGALAGQPR
ncbi:hypothetical protein [Streptomyces reniochalinae]|uniref:Uncharacterized protein n=1 Tax=Streptomyces reniochalinae TaxID=2250578 RepID=A0A367ED29_9ACTN|nr:hypothetical protein [Streptomyces reniochalinae]RCG15257.1 hypothetical protein DQ392_23985 [Streptomyces reniochalinae]